MSNSNKVSVYLNEKEESVMRVLWNSETPLSASEVANRIGLEWALKSIQNIVRKLEAKNAIEVAEITKLGKTYGRLFRATITAEEYAVMQFNRFYDKDKDISLILSALTGDQEENPELSKDLKQLMKKYKTK